MLSSATEEEIQYATRRKAISDRDVLHMATEGIDVEKLTEAEKNALQIFQNNYIFNVWLVDNSTHLMYINYEEAKLWMTKILNTR